jgi:8-oxo-dGTP pyrophosphatase MutT (NUDIX family)
MVRRFDGGPVDGLLATKITARPRRPLSAGESTAAPSGALQIVGDRLHSSTRGARRLSRRMRASGSSRGVCDPARDADAAATALREAYEEIGTPSGRRAAPGALDDIATVSSRFLITPFVGLVPHPYTWVPSPREVDTVFSVALGACGRRWPSGASSGTSTAHAVPIDFFPIDGQVIWGRHASDHAKLLLEGAWEGGVMRTVVLLLVLLVVQVCTVAEPPGADGHAGGAGVLGASTPMRSDGARRGLGRWPTSRSVLCLRAAAGRASCCSRPIRGAWVSQRRRDATFTVRHRCRGGPPPEGTRHSRSPRARLVVAERLPFRRHVVRQATIDVTPPGSKCSPATPHGVAGSELIVYASRPTRRERRRGRRRTFPAPPAT